MSVGMCISEQLCGSQRTIRSSRFSRSLMWFLGMEFPSSDLVARVFIC